MKKLQNLLIMKDKPVSKARREEWERFLKQNQQLPIYMGDHMTRPWTRQESAADSGCGEETKHNLVRGSKSQNSLGRSGTPTTDGHPKVLALTRSQYSIRKVQNGKRRLKSSKEILMRHQITDEDILTWQDSFDSLLSSPAGRYVFKLFLESEVADENLKFWLACEELKHTKAKKKVVKLIQEIYSTYIDVYSPHEINIEYKMREEIIEKLRETMDISVFTKAQHQVYNLMHRDSYPRFLTSPFLADLINALSKRRESESMKAIQEETMSRTSTAFIACCCCRAGSDRDIITEDQRTASTSVAYRTSDAADRDEPVQANQQKTNSLILHDFTVSDPNSIETSPNYPEDLRNVPKENSSKE